MSVIPVDVSGVSGRESCLTVAEDFHSFYDREYRPVLDIVFALSGSWAVAEEITQDAFVQAHRRWVDVASHVNPEGWVRTVALNLARSSLRRRVVEAKAVVRLASEPVGAADLPEGSDRVWRAVRGLPTNQARAIVLRYYDDRSIDEIAGLLGCAASTVRVHLHRGRRTLAEQLGLELDEESE